MRWVLAVTALTSLAVAGCGEAPKGATTGNTAGQNDAQASPDTSSPPQASSATQKPTADPASLAAKSLDGISIYYHDRWPNTTILLNSVGDQTYGVMLNKSIVGDTAASEPGNFLQCTVVAAGKRVGSTVHEASGTEIGGRIVAQETDSATGAVVVVKIDFKEDGSLSVETDNVDQRCAQAASDFDGTYK